MLVMINGIAPTECDSVNASGWLLLVLIFADVFDFGTCLLLCSVFALPWPRENEEALWTVQMVHNAERISFFFAMVVGVGKRCRLTNIICNTR